MNLFRVSVLGLLYYNIHAECRRPLRDDCCIGCNGYMMGGVVFLCSCVSLICPVLKRVSAIPSFLLLMFVGESLGYICVGVCF